jgi:hypothetical protein
MTVEDVEDLDQAYEPPTARDTVTTAAGVHGGK